MNNILLTTKKGNTTYYLKKGFGNWLLFERVITTDNKNITMKENFSLNTYTKEVYCNRTGVKTMGFKRYLALALRIEKIFKLSSLLDF